MKLGTKSLLFGSHQFLIHPYYVLKAWKNIYGSVKDYRILLAILIHDWGYFGKDNMDGDDGQKHPEFAARIMGKLFGDKWGEFCLYHSTSYAISKCKPISKLCIVDKLAFNLEYRNFYLLRSRLTGELEEYKLMNLQRIKKEHDVELLNMSDDDWYTNTYFAIMRKVLRLLEELPKDE